MLWKKKEEKEEYKQKFSCGDWKQGDKVQRIGLKNLGIVIGFNEHKIDSVYVEWIKQDPYDKNKVCLVNAFMYPFSLKKADMDDISCDGEINGEPSYQYKNFYEEGKN